MISAPCALQSGAIQIWISVPLRLCLKACTHPVRIIVCAALKAWSTKPLMNVCALFPKVADAITTPADIKHLWDVCQIPDFRNLTIDAHVRLLQDIYRLLIAHQGKLPDDYLEKQMNRLDDTLGSVDTLSSRLAHIRTWTYCASKPSWVDGAKNWINTAREVEDRLSDALHQGLIERFVDRRTSKLLKGIGADSYMNATIKDNGEVWAEDQLIGQLDGFKFIPAPSGTELEAKALQAAAEQVVAPEIDRQLTSLCGGSHAIFYTL